MDRFVQLLADLSQRDARHVRCYEHVRLIVEYLKGTKLDDRTWAIYLLWGHRPRRQCSTKEILAGLSEWPEWMIDACVTHTRDSLGTCAHLVARARFSSVERSTLLARSFDVESPAWIEVGNQLTVRAVHFYLQFLTGTFVAPVYRVTVAEALGEYWNCSPFAVQQGERLARPKGAEVWREVEKAGEVDG